MTRAVPQHWLLFAGPGDTGLAVQLEPVMSKNGVTLSFTPGPIGERLDIELKTSENNNSALIDAYGDLENSAKNGGSYGYAFLQSEGHLRNEASFRFQFEKKYLNGDVLQNVSGASADLLFGLAVVTAVRSDLEYRPFAATGILSEDRQVQPIEGLQAKIRAALNIPALCEKGLIFYPKANNKDIDAELRHRVERAQIALKPVEWLEEAVEYLGIPIQGTWIGNPYRRLDVFEYSHRRIFFGREDVTESLAIKLSDRATLERPSLLILGPSGGGKSSLVQAGLIPELEKRFKEENLSLLYSIFDLKSAANKDIQLIAASIRSSWGLLPGLAALAVSNTSKQQVAVTPSDVFEALVCDLLTYLPDQTRFVWVLDQLEQFFTLGLTKEADAAFIHFLCELQARGIWIVATFRNDFYGALKAHDGISSVFDKDGTHDLENLSETTIERIIQKPAELAKLEFEKDDQKSELLSLKLKNDALEGGKDILPLLEFALDQLYEKREQKNGRTQLTWAAYEAMGGLQGAIGNRADEVLRSLDQATQETLGRVLRALAKLRRDSVENESGKSNFIASVANLENFLPDTPAHRLIDAFAEARLFVRDRDNEGIAQVRVTHEALFTHWSKAKEILKDSMKDLELRERLRDRAVHWKGDDVLRGLPLAEAQDLLARLGDELDAEIVHYIEQSSIAYQERKQKESEAQRRKTRLTTITAVVLGVLLIVAMGAIYYVNEARNEQTQMLASSYFSEGARLVDEGRSKEALAYLAQAMRLDSSPDTAAARLAASLLLSPENHIITRTIRIPCRYEGTVEFSPDGRLLLTVCDRIPQIWDVITGKQLSFSPIKHKDVVHARFSPDGRWLTTTSWDGTARIWEAATGIVTTEPKEYDEIIRATFFSPDGRWVVTASLDNSIRIWEAATRKLTSIIYEKDIDAIGFSPDGRWIVIRSLDKVNTVRVWEAATGKPELKINESNIRSIGFSPESNWVVVASADKKAHVWEITSGMPVSNPMYHDEDIVSVEFSPDGRWLVTVSVDNSVRIWEATTGVLIAELPKHTGFIPFAKFSPDGNFIVTTITEKIAQVWDSATGKEVSKPLQHKDEIRSFEFSPDGRWVVTASIDQTVQVWEAATGALVSQPIKHGGIVELAKFSPTGRWVATTSIFGGNSIIQVWRMVAGSMTLKPAEHEEDIAMAQLSPDGRWVATASWDKTARVWDVMTEMPVSRPMQHDEFVKLVKFSPDGRLVVTATWYGIRIWEAATGKPLSPLIKHEYHVKSAHFTPDGRWVVTTSSDTAHVWDVVTGKLVFSMKHENSVESALFSPDGFWVATSFSYYTKIWEVTTGKIVSPLIEHEYHVKSAHFSPDGRCVATTSSDKSARVWDVMTGESVSKPMQHESTINSVQFSSDGSRVVTASEDNTARIWSAANGEPISQPMRHLSSVESAQFSPDGRWIITVTSDKTVRIWEAKTGKPIGVSLGRVGSVQFNPDGRYITGVSNNAVRVWEFPQLSEISLGLIEFLERLSGYIVNSNNVLQEKYNDLIISELRDWTTATTNLTLTERTFIDWWLNDPFERTITPTNKQTVKERVQMLIDYDTITSLNEALDYYPGHPMALASLAAATWRETKTDQQNDIRSRVALWANLALKYAPDDTAVRAVAEKVLQDIAAPPN